MVMHIRVTMSLAKWTFSSLPTISPCASYLDDRFHETGGRGIRLKGGTDGLLADSSFAVGETRSCIMAGWRRAVELAMSDEEIATLTTLSRSRI
jgi:hypothetical protein